MAIAQITTHQADSVNRLLSQYDRPLISSLVSGLAGGVQNIEDATFSLLGAFDLSTASGAQLDVLGGLIGVSRYGLSDAQMRVLLYGLISLHNGNATAATLVQVAQALFQTDQVFFADGQAGKNGAQIGRSSVILGIGDTKLPADAVAMATSLIGQAVGAGIELSFVSSFASNNAFACQGPQPWVSGYASVATPDSGGAMSGLLA